MRMRVPSRRPSARGPLAALSLIAALCLTQGFIPGTLNCQRIDPTLCSHVQCENQARPVRRVLSNIFGFGGNNCSLVLGVL